MTIKSYSNGDEPEIVDTSQEEDEGHSNAKYEITSYGADYTIDSLVERMKTGHIYIPTFQRSYVWSITQASKFIESLLLGLPVPGIFLSKDSDRRLVVIDGQQRLSSLHRFYEGAFEDRVFALKGVRKDFESATYKTLRDDDRRQLDDSILHATIIQQVSPEDDDSSVYHIFERLNTGGTKLQPQEIRASIYHGPLIDLLGVLNDYAAWRDIYGIKNKRGKDQELILRFLSLYFKGDEYQKPLNEFLNRFAHTYRRLDFKSLEKMRNAFTSTIDIVNNSLGKQAFRSQRVLNAAVFDAIMVGIARRLEKGAITDSSDVRDTHDQLISNPDFQKFYTGPTTDEKSVESRIRMATDAFANVK